MTDWLDPGAWEHVAKTAAAVVDALTKLRDAMSRRKKAAQPGDTRNLDEEVDALQKNVQQFVDVMMQHVTSNRQVWEAIINVLGPADAPAGESGTEKIVGILLKPTVQLRDRVQELERRLQTLERGQDAPPTTGTSRH